jgi:hypothetical protein
VVYDISSIILYSFIGFLSMIAGAVLYEGDWLWVMLEVRVEWLIL